MFGMDYSHSAKICRELETMNGYFKRLLELLEKREPYRT